MTCGGGDMKFTEDSFSKIADWWEKDLISKKQDALTSVKQTWQRVVLSAGLDEILVGCSGIKLF